jgi:hypothetical protein
MNRERIDGGAMSNKPVENAGAKKSWEDPALRKVGSVGAVLQGGGGKLSIVADDSGDSPRKPKGQG